MELSLIDRTDRGKKRLKAVLDIYVVTPLLRDNATAQLGQIESVRF
jgi:hypothetical protein